MGVATRQPSLAERSERKPATEGREVAPSAAESTPWESAKTLHPSRARSLHLALIRRGFQVAARLGHHRGLLGAPRILPSLNPASAFGSSTDSMVNEFPTQPDGQCFPRSLGLKEHPKSPLPSPRPGQVGSVLRSNLIWQREGALGYQVAPIQN